MTVWTSHHGPSSIREVREDIIYSVDKLINLWLEHEGREFRHAVAKFSFWSSLAAQTIHPFTQDFLLNELHLHPPASTTHPAPISLLPGPPEDVLPGLSVQP